mgnify:CR=1 FL=1
MNNLKFRVWDKKLQISGTVSNIDFEYEEVTFYIDDEEELETCQPFEDVVLMQSTGLKDKNGVEIFEGDIVSRFKNTVEEVVWNSRKGWWAIQTRGEIGLTVLAQFIEVVEIIGNIYENKELIENEI